MKNILFIKIITLIVILLSTGVTAYAQSSSDYALGNTLLRQGEFEEAFDIFERLMRQNPSSYPVYDRAMTALINLRRLDEAIEISKKRLDSRYADFNTWVKLGELYHIDRQFEKATETWIETIEKYGSEMQVYRQVARTMSERRDFEGAIKVYEMAREQFNNPTMFQQEIASMYLAAGDYEKGMRENLKLIATNRNFVYAVQRQLNRFDEPYLYDIAILETEDAIADNRNNQELVTHYRDFLIWLQMERQLYRRAMATSRTIERENQNRYAIYELGTRLVTREEFELARDAFMHYYEIENHPHRARAIQELAGVYIQWAQFKVSRNMDFDGASKELYSRASELISELNADYPNYSNRAQVLAMQIELALDYLKDLNKAEKYFEQFETIADRERLNNEAGFYKGRLHLFRGEFALARVEFSRVNRAVRSGSLADESRYYLALGDFYNNEYEFARLQMRSLERQNSSFYANNALRLRVWIQNGTTKDDSLKTEINTFAKAHYQYSIGDYEASLELLTTFFNEYPQHSLLGESILLATQIIRRDAPELAFLTLYQFQDQIKFAPTKENLLWNMANLADLIVRGDSQSEIDVDDPDFIDQHDDMIQSFFNAISDSETARDFLPKDLSSVIELYENLLVEFPQGFYARSARNRIQELQNVRQAS